MLHFLKIDRKSFKSTNTCTIHVLAWVVAYQLHVFVLSASVSIVHLFVLTFLYALCI